jgi:hypothetical protein
MKKIDSLPIPGPAKTIAAILSVVLALACACCAGYSQTAVPTDASIANVSDGLSLAPPVFNSWFASGTVTLNGAVNPADSITFTNFQNWAFHQWAENMFLWLTSPTPESYGGSGRVLTSPVFYNVSPPDGNGQRTLTQNTAGNAFFRMMVRKAQVGPEALPVVMDKAGVMHNVEPLLLGPTGKPLIVDRLGRSVEIQHVNIGPAGQLTLLDRSGKVIESRLGPLRTPLLSNRQGRMLRIVRIIPGLNESLIFLDQFDNAIEFGEGQADGSDSVLMAQNGSLVYFSIFVNDEYAYFLTGNNHGAFTPAQTTFPTNTAQMQQIYSYALAHGHTLTDSNTLTMEIKTAWIETKGLDTSKYITINATIPNYNTNNPGIWLTNGTRQAQLALVGIHIVGSANNHPEMIWATFEHMNNTPDDTYTYTATPNVAKTVTQSTSGNWLFCASGSTGPFNVPRITVNPVNGSLTAQPPATTIGPSDTLRVMAWGASTNESPNPVDPAAADANSEIIDINNRVHQMLAPGDVRTNYILVGATFTSAPGQNIFIGDGDLPNSDSVPYPDVPNPPATDIIDEVGASQLANSTLETYTQPATPAYDSSINCFACHQGNALGASNGSGLSHIYGQIQPLF